MSKTRPAYIVRNFKDAGTEQRFSKGEVKPIAVGQFDDWKLAGLVREPNADELKAARLENSAEAKPA
ncbi:hypothetical protein CA223_06825 [Sphingomonas koreensis]|uniref:DUF2635 domain-containing protein n=1 Tax=Sphingomonas koreensis TaxID=93064 RepID=A0A1L6J8V5_9SPHN|nr:hypothetical protein [Sphingomonas koreensis]APR51990.1 hypothetical protein BRX40_05655 [Sphingomonas koreensis]RSU22792.1 hypothetical protein CA224_05275 [Sphingomonas koreensis]RSU30734.1 hypothetical protein CA222_01270 [Sphingomonas koreensis]RSU39250.1 hypothetical protein BRX39_01180 [Sphingomonas koreensis]RSU40958.1 hypothetical protein CA223_06825 [Sphingomonas koreensis]